MARACAPLTATMVALAAAACESRTVVPLEVESVDIVPSSFTLVEGESRSAQAVPRGGDGSALTGRTVAWAVDAPNVATVDGSGRLQGVGAGQTTVRATVEGVTGSAPVTVLPGPSIELSRTAVSLGAVSGEGSGSEVVSVTNGGNGMLSGLSARITYGSGGPSGWLTAGLSGTTAPAELSISASAEALDPGSYRATVTVETTTGGGLSADVDVELTVEAPPPLIVLDIGGEPVEEVALNALEGGQVPAVQVVAVTNGGGGILGGLSTSIVYAEGEPDGWLRADLDGFVAPTVLTLEASPGALSPGVYHASVEVRSDQASNSPRSLPLLFTVSVARPAGLPPTPSEARSHERTGPDRAGEPVRERAP